MISDYDGSEVVDRGGKRIGTVERSYIDDQGSVRFVEVAMRGLRAKHRLIPVDDAKKVAHGLKVPFSKDVVEASPNVSYVGDTVEEETLIEVRAYYQRHDETVAPSAVEPAAIPTARSETSGDSDSKSSGHGEGVGDKLRGAVEQVRQKLPGSSGSGGDQDGVSTGDSGRVRDLGDVIEVPILEEKLVKRPVVTEVLRIRKRSVSEGQMVSSDVRKEDIEVDEEGNVRT